jgi:hypothetical protein
VKPYLWISLAVIAGWAAGCTSIPGTVKSKQIGKLASPLQDVAVIFVEGQETPRMGSAFGEKLTHELQQRFSTRNISGATYYFDRQDSNLDSKLKASKSDHHHGHQLVIVPSLVIPSDSSEAEDSVLRHIIVGFVLSETSPNRLVWQGNATFVGRPREGEIADQLVERMIADGILK